MVKNFKRYDINEILLNLALNTNQSTNQKIMLTLPVKFDTCIKQIMHKLYIKVH